MLFHNSSCYTCTRLAIALCSQHVRPWEKRQHTLTCSATLYLAVLRPPPPSSSVSAESDESHVQYMYCVCHVCNSSRSYPGRVQQLQPRAVGASKAFAFRCPTAYLMFSWQACIALLPNMLISGGRSYTRLWHLCHGRDKQLYPTIASTPHLYQSRPAKASNSYRIDNV